MFILRLATIGLLGLSAATALAQAPSVSSNSDRQAGLNNTDSHVSMPRSDKSGNIVPADTTSAVAPTLPSSALSIDAGALEYLRAARASLVAGQTGAAQQSLEMAETRTLGGGALATQATSPNDNPKVVQIREALHALGAGDKARAIQIIDQVMAN